MVSGKEVAQSLKWRVMVPGGSSVRLEMESGPVDREWPWLYHLVLAAKLKVSGFMKRAWKIGADDPRKAVHCIKVGLALTLVSVFYYIRPLYDGVGGTAMWAIMTVVVIFEFTVGGSLYKGLNRAIATLSAGALAVGIHWLASKSGETAEHMILGSAVFLLSSAATFSRFIPTIKVQFDYGITIFILTFNLVALSGYRVDELLELAEQRLTTVAIGISICLLVCILGCPVWAGEELHLLITCNMEKLADSLVVCVDKYLQEGGIDGDKEASHQNLQGYKCVLNSKASEDSLANLARWEPAHGRFRFRYPWRQYLKVGAAMRYCAYCIETLNSCMNSESRAPEYIKKHIRDGCVKLSLECSEVLKELASSIKSMKKSSRINYLVGEKNNAVEELLDAFKSLQQADSAPLLGSLPLVTVASLLIEISVRTDGVVDAVETLASLACFEPVDGEKPGLSKPPTSSLSSIVSQGEDAMKTLEHV
ncbi:aluminum-activated malate transporter 10-like [Phoenix dactylifera]|uniref:Aluminum-activated malate transporter 10-like n=1 Tax=Phoenix dactylifera TaxID=42345 RepID=A0A8B7D0F2_PHODC|nr:aluminum-activated malate transporter 10-like [Phoenix dactylifera]